MVLMCSAVCTRSSLEPHSFSASMASWGWGCVLASLNMLWGCSATSAVSVLPCTGGRTAERALGLFSYQCCVRAALYRGQDCRTCSGVVQLPVLCPCCLVQGAGLQNMLWGCSAITVVSVLPCTGGRTAEHALGLFSYQCCVRAALYRGQDCRTCSGVVQLSLLCPCCHVQGAGLQNVLWGCSATSAVSVLPYTGGRTAERALGLFSYKCCVRAALYRGQDCRTCSGVVQLQVLCPCSLVQGAGLQNMLWGCSATSSVSVQPCTGGRTAEHALGLSATSAVSVLPCTGGRTAEHALWLSATSAVSVLPCTGGRTAERALGLSATSAVSVLPCTGGRTAERALGLFSYQCCVRAALYRGQDCRTWSVVVQLSLRHPCCRVQGAGLQNMLCGLRACLTWALGFLGLSHLGFMGLSRMGSGVCGPVSHGLWGLLACLEKAVHCVFHTKVRQVGLQSNLYQKNRNLAIWAWAFIMLEEKCHLQSFGYLPSHLAVTPQLVLLYS